MPDTSTSETVTITPDGPTHTRPAIQPPKRAAKVVAAVIAGLVVVCLAVAGGWAWGRVSSPPTPPEAARTATTVTTTVGTLYENTRLTAAITWPDVTVFPPFVDGIVTERTLNEPGKIGVGTRLYSVDLMPIFAARGTVPSFRLLELDSRGKDVAQLQNFLRATKKRRTKSTGVFDEATKAQVEAWQQATKQDVTGTIPAGQLQFFPTLPVDGYLTTTTTVGTTVSKGGSPGSDQGMDGQRPAHGPGVAVRTSAPIITAELNPVQQRRVRIGTKATLKHEGVTLNLVAASITPLQQREGSLATFTLAEGNSMPQQFVESLPPEGLSGIGLVAEIVPRTEGVLVPTTALSVDPGGGTSVRGSDGISIPVTVKVTVGGEAIVDGVTAGTTLRVETRE